MSAKRAAGRWIARASGLLGGLRDAGGLRVLLYHAIGTPLPSASYGLTVSIECFREQMMWLRDQRDIELVSLEAGVRLLDRSLSRRLVAVTFDDGYLDNLTTAAPLLCGLRIPFAVFVTVAHLLPRTADGHLFLSNAGLRELAGLTGVSVGAHGYSHRPMTRLSQPELCMELANAKSRLEEVTQRRISSLSYPHGAVNAQVMEAAKACGYVSGATSFIGLNRPGIAPLLVHRTEITGDDDLEDFRRKVQGDYDWYGLKQRLYWPVPRG